MRLAVFILANILIGYLCGSCTFAIVIGKYLLKKDPRDFGSGNAGATNSFRLYGKKFGSLILILDVLKTLIPTLIIWGVTKNITNPFPEVPYDSVFNPYALVYLCPVSAIIGHCYPIYFKFRGGKGAACYGALIWLLSPWIGMIATALFILTAKKSKMVSFAVLLVAAFIPFLILIPGLNYLYLENIGVHDTLQVFSQYGSLLFLFFLLCGTTLLVIYRHRSNIQRIKEHSEGTITEIFRDHGEIETTSETVATETTVTGDEVSPSNSTVASSSSTTGDFVMLDGSAEKYPKDIEKYKHTKNITHELTVVEKSDTDPNSHPTGGQ